MSYQIFTYVISLALFLPVSINSLYAPYVQFFPVNTCSGPHKYTFESIPDFESTFPEQIFAVSGRGLWEVHHYVKSNPTQLLRSMINNPDGRLCLGLGKDEQIASVEKILNSDLEFSEIAFFTDFLGGERFTTNRTEYSFPNPMSVQTIVFSGISDYTVYIGPNFSGESECLQLNKEPPHDRGYQLTVKVTTRTVGSVRVGCSGDTKIFKSEDGERPIIDTKFGQVLTASAPIVDTDKNEVKTFITQSN